MGTSLMGTSLFDTTGQLLLAAMGLLLLIQLVYYFCLYYRIHLQGRAVRQNNVHFSQELPPLSVIIFARQESVNLQNNLSAILEQDYPLFEVIVINDGEGSDNEDYLTLLEDKYPNLYHSFVPRSSRYISRKKLGVTLGIKASKYDWLVFTEANCLPQSNQWLRLLARNFTSRTQIVLGYSGYERERTWLNKQVAFDCLFSSIRYLSFALTGSPYMGIGRNMAYRKELFYQQKGFSSHLNLQLGDDDLFINKVATADNTRVETDVNATVRIQPSLRLKDWKEEKIGYASTARVYQGMQRYVAGFETLTRLAFYMACVAALIIGTMQYNWLMAGIALFLWLVRFAVQAFIINITAKDLGEKQRYYLTLPLFDWLQPLQSLHWKLYCFFRKRSGFLRR